jgi:hypothetical protein
MSKGERIWNKFSTALTAFFAASGRRVSGRPSGEGLGIGDRRAGTEMTQFRPVQADRRSWEDDGLSALREPRRIGRGNWSATEIGSEKV